jgi:alpha-beta hydrolase superfamily lysophospholipase
MTIVPRAIRALVVAVSLTATGCKLDSFLYDGKALASYTLSTAVIADSLRTTVSFPSGNATLYGVWARQPGTAPRLTVLYSHGNSDHLAYYWDRVELLWRAGFDVFIYDYRGYGMSTGTSDSEASILADARAALGVALARPGVTPASLVLYGYSLGGVPTIALAADAVRARAVITESAFASGETLVQSGTLLAVPRSYLLDGAFDNATRAGRVTTPWLIVHGVEDDYLDLENARTLRARAGGPTRLVTVAGAGHKDLPWRMGLSSYQTLVRGWAETPVP